MKTLIRLLGIDLYGCKTELLNDAAQLEHLLLKAAKEMGATPLGAQFQRFEPQGVSGVIIIAESHLAIHTWPELGYAAVTFETCGENVEPWRAVTLLQRELGASEIAHFERHRGLHSPETVQISYQRQKSSYYG